MSELSFIQSSWPAECDGTKNHTALASEILRYKTTGERDAAKQHPKVLDDDKWSEHTVNI